MSSKRIQKRLDQLFIDIKQAEETSLISQKAEPTELETREIAPWIQQEPPSVSLETGHSVGRVPDRGEASQPLSTDTLNLAQDVHNNEPTTIALPFRTGLNTWSVLEVFSPSEKHGWNQDEQLLARQVTDQLSLALENARLLNETQQRNLELATLNEIISSASQL